MRVRGPGFRDVLGLPEFRSLWGAELLSILGDQLAGVALAVLVYQQTASAALSALTYALTFAPAVLGGALLSGLADRFPRRRVLVITDLLRAGLAATMAIPGLPLPALWTLVALLSMSAAPFKAAQLALLPQILDGDRYVVGLSLRQVTNQGSQLVGFASGGLLVAAVEPHLALATNASTFLLSAALIMFGVRARPAASATAVPDDPLPPTVRLVGNRQLLAVAIVICLAGLFVVPEGIAAPYGAAVGVGTVGVGLLMAADPLGSVIGAWLVARMRIRPTRRSTVLLAAGAGVPLLVCATQPGLVLSITLWAASGALSTAAVILAQALVVRLVPDHRRGRVMGRIATCLYTSQGLAIVAGGIAAQATGPFRAVAGAGLLGIVLVLCVGVWWRPVARSRRDLAAGSERGFEQGETASHVPVRHPGHLLPNSSEQAFQRGEDRSHVAVRHPEHLLPMSRRLRKPSHMSRCAMPDTSFHTAASRAETSHMSRCDNPNTSFEQPRGGAKPVTYRGVPSRTPPSKAGLAGSPRAASHIPVSHHGHLLADVAKQAFQRGEGRSHVPVRHERHLLPGRFTMTAPVAWLNARFWTLGLPSGTQAPSLWAWAARATRGRIVAGRMATA